MKKDEPFDPSIKSKNSPSGLIFRLADRKDCNAIASLMAERNPLLSIDKMLENTHREIDRVESDEKYKLYVAELNGEVVGFCRFYHSAGLPTAKKVYPSQEGWYGMGIMVSSKFRRQNIAHFLSTQRIEVLKAMGVEELYSIVDLKNLTSMKMHQQFGYREVARASGFLHLSFGDGIGCLFKISIK